MPLRCLIVDDSASFLEVARVLLERERLSVVCVTSTSDEALRRAGELRPDVVLVDITPGLMGVEKRNYGEHAKRLGTPACVSGASPAGLHRDDSLRQRRFAVPARQIAAG